MQAHRHTHVASGKQIHTRAHVAWAQVASASERNVPGICIAFLSLPACMLCLTYEKIYIYTHSLNTHSLTHSRTFAHIHTTACDDSRTVDRPQHVVLGLETIKFFSDMDIARWLRGHEAIWASGMYAFTCVSFEPQVCSAYGGMCKWFYKCMKLSLSVCLCLWAYVRTFWNVRWTCTQTRSSV